MASVACARGDEADSAVQMLAVIPIGEGFHPSLSLCFCGKALGRPVRAVFAGSEQSLREGIIIADPRSAVGRGDAQFLHRGFHRGTFHRAAIVGVQNKRLHKTTLRQHRLPDQVGRQVRTFALMNFPANNLAAKDIHDQV